MIPKSLSSDLIRGWIPVFGVLAFADEVIEQAEFCNDALSAAETAILLRRTLVANGPNRTCGTRT